MRYSELSSFLRTRMRGFAKDTSGVSAVIIAMAAIPILGTIGMSVDLARAYVLKSKLSTALDAAGLAAGRNIFASDAEIYADAQKYFDANFPSGYMGTSPITMDASTVSWDATRERVTLSADVDMDTSFMNVLGFSSLTLGATTEINRENRGMELVLVLDNTGSMDYYTSGTKRLETLKQASKNLVDILYGTDETKDKLWVSVVPYTTQVNVGPHNIGFLPQADRNNLLTNAGSIFTSDSTNTSLGFDVDLNGSNDTVYGWEGCVEMRDHLMGGTQDLSDDPPNEDFIPYFYTTTSWSSSQGKYVQNTSNPNRYCPPPILPLTAEKTTIKDHIDDMEASGATAVQVGLVWGWRAISPRWNGAWYNSSTVNIPSGYTGLPLNYGEDFMDKVVVLMTDGENTLGTYGIYHAYGRQKQLGKPTGHPDHNPLYADDGSGTLTGDNSGSTYKTMDDTKTAAACENMKAQGVIIYTVIFVSGNENLFRNCATSPKHYFKAATATALINDFNTIGEELSNLRISK